ncbi:phage baseplate assembly protein V [Vibrio sp. OPT18]|uniref:phage baseplate assembly protein V n=1 Tax=Vibrio sp. OPT18 TaxID=2778641 RepID=UPI001880A197|nr:phage baseplate assembly protein V [Vibrio sp. OPT18]MBE8578711.1 phage baseplate assembly protein V [Vibrio sp. OPT18]
MKIFKELSMRIDKIYTRLVRIVSVGEVIEVDGASHRVKVALKGLDDVPSVWLPVLAFRAKSVSVVHNLSKGEQVVCLFPPVGDMAKGFVLGALYNQEDKPFQSDVKVYGMKFDDETVITYDEGKQTLLVEIGGGGPKFTMDKNGTKLISKFDIDGDVTISKTLSVKNAVTFDDTLAVKKDVTVESNLQVKKDVFDKSGSMMQIRMIYSGHNHTTAVGPTTPPIQPMA